MCIDTTQQFCSDRHYKEGCSEIYALRFHLLRCQISVRFWKLSLFGPTDHEVLRLNTRDDVFCLGL